MAGMSPLDTAYINADLPQRSFWLTYAPTASSSTMMSRLLCRHARMSGVRLFLSLSLTTTEEESLANAIRIDSLSPLRADKLPIIQNKHITT